MDLLSGLWTYMVPFLIVLTVLVFVHELGHYWVARRAGVKVEVFSIGFGPELFGWNDRSGTRWKVSALPLGGYVKMYGEQEESGQGQAPADTADAASSESFQAKTLGWRAAIVAAGPAANFLFAILIYAVLFGFVGQPFTPPVVGAVLAGSAADQGGLQAGDRIVRIDGRGIERFEEIQRAVQLGLEQPLQMVVERDGREQALTVRPQIVEETDRNGKQFRVARLGIRGQGVAYVSYGPVESILRAAQETWNQTTGTLRALGQMVSGHRATDDLGGPIRIAQMSGEVAQGGVAALIVFMAVLSINLGLINLFPIPMLDGGHLLFYAAEAVRGRPLGARAQEYGFRIGLALVLSLMVFATWNDLVHLRIVSYIVELVS